jgi:RNA recognition motif-containing protein
VSNNKNIPRSKCQVFLGNLSYDADERMIKEAFDAIDVRITNVRIVLDRESRLPKGFAFVDIDPKERTNLEEIIKKIDGTMFYDRPCRASHVIPRAPECKQGTAQSRQDKRRKRGETPQRGPGRGSRRDGDDYGW